MNIQHHIYKKLSQLCLCFSLHVYVVGFPSMAVTKTGQCCWPLFFSGYLATLFRLSRIYSIKWKDDMQVMNLKGYVGYQPWPVLRYYASTCLEGLSKTTIKFSQSSLSPEWDSKLEPPEYKTWAVTTQLWYSLGLLSTMLLQCYC